MTPSLLAAQARRAYPLVLLFLGCVVTLGTFFVAMGAIMTYHQDPAITGGNSVQLVIFGALAALACWGLYLVTRPKFGRWSELWPATFGARPRSTVPHV
ncbi:MAG: hypothetical protein L3K06_04460 [Thermoplasmata archaeon]|nr:hypothetical protein [Thermoplasmata archaeon]